MKTRVILVLMLLLFILPMQGVSAKLILPPDVKYNGAGLWTVFPHTSSPDDPNRIQAVVDLARPGDTVRLAAGTFDFSEFENVRIAKDLTVEGAWDAKQQMPLTTIKNGYVPILIGRKTPVEKPALEMINGHAVYHITPDLFGKFLMPMGYLWPETYHIFDDWIPVKVNIRQITFQRAYGAAIFVGAMNGGSIEKVRIESAWPFDQDYQTAEGGDNGFGILMFNPAVSSLMEVDLGRFYDPNAYYGTDLIRGNLVIQDNYIDGDMVDIADGQSDEAGDLVVALYDPENPTPPPNEQYDKYVLQDVTFAWDEKSLPDPASIKTYWVKKGYSAMFYAGQFYSERGIFPGIGACYTQANLVIRRNVITDTGLGMLFEENGFKGVPLNALITDNRISAQPNATWTTGFWNVGWDHYNPFTQEMYHAETGENILLRNNTFQARNPNQFWWESVVRISMYGRAVVEGNHIDLVSGNGIIMGWPSQEVKVFANTITGTGSYALFDDWGSNGNLMLPNDLRRFVPTGSGNEDVGAPPAQVLLLSDNNTVVGGRGASEQVVWDYGVNNKVVGMIHQIGQPPVAALKATAPRNRPGRLIVR